MVIAILIVFGLAFGSFVNALVWRLHEQADLKSRKKVDTKRLKELSISQGRSMCPHCGHGLSAKDLVPVLSWLSLKGRCRYCGTPISIQYPVIELATAAVFVMSYLFWPEPLEGAQVALFSVWLPLVIGLMALLVYDTRWLLLPNRLMYPLTVLAALEALITILAAESPIRALLNVLAAVVVGGGIFYLLFQVSAGRWIGGGDVKLGWLLGLVVATPARSLLFIFIAALLGTAVSLPLLYAKRLKASSVIPFGPFLIVAAILTQLFGSAILSWYRHLFLPFAG